MNEGSGKWYSLDRNIEVLDGAVDERGQLEGGALDLSGILGDVELRHELVEHLDALGVFLGSHFCVFFRCMICGKKVYCRDC